MDDESGFGASLRLIVTALVSAVVTATLVIGIGQAVLDPAGPRAPSPSPLLIAARH
ncbi:hypothetical protein [Brevundimonas sp. LM2]|uniref:hypothetical protein n=1 Tax=Brevundimonas sp. LM2 TaxID=1938605 RepID=UPI0015C53486|nr:hypothetical protein [Brevundimonas sp. LM2]